MSTFDGIIEEFPEIRVDYFRHHAGRTPPAAVFLSHIHSDHLLGLETLKMPFVYCSATTRRILLKMEKYPHRINFAKGVLEARRQTYKHLKLILRALPLDTPVELEISPKCRIRVTLLDANHCPGAVMFLIEDEARAILYTGDVRAEPWWVNSLARNPVMIPYTMGQKRLNCVYLDTTFASHEDIYKHFPSKAEGLSELLSKVSKCHSNSVFYFRAWTLGYEDVWIALSTALRSKVHVDEYQHRLFRSSLPDGNDTYPTAALTGYRVGNQEHEGCLTQNREASIHSCEPGMACYAALRKQRNVVWITPIISRQPDGTEVAEVGAGGGKGDLYQLPELDLRDQAAQQALQMLCEHLMGTERAAAYLKTAFEFAMTQRDFRFALEGLGLPPDEEMTLERFVEAIANRDQSSTIWDNTRQSGVEQKVIHFPYSRHSSYSESRELIGLLRPEDVCPCTVDLDSWGEDVSMGSLFGDLCTSSIFRHDQIIRQQAQLRQEAMRDMEDSNSSSFHGQHSQENVEHETTHRLGAFEDREIDQTSPIASLVKAGATVNMPQVKLQAGNTTDLDTGQDSNGQPTRNQTYFREAWRTMNSDSQMFVVGQDGRVNKAAESNDTQVSVATSILDLKDNHKGDWKACVEAYNAAKACLEFGDSNAWDDLRIRSVGWTGHTEREMELG